MSTGRDDDALTWGGDDDPTLDARTGPGSPGLPEGYTAVGRGSEKIPSSSMREPAGDERHAAEAEDAAAPPALGNAALVALGILGGIYLLYAIGWLVGGLRLQGIAAFLVSADGQAPPTWAAGNIVVTALAVAAPAIWFAAVVLLTRGAAAWMRWTLLAAGVLVLIPWPFIMVGVIGS